jgi:hypothetical protein
MLIPIAKALGVDKILKFVSIPIFGFLVCYVYFPLVVVFLFSPIFLIHWAFQYCGRQLRPELLQLVNARGNLTAALDGRKRRSFGLILEGCPSKEQLLNGAD